MRSIFRLGADFGRSKFGPVALVIVAIAISAAALSFERSIVEAAGNQHRVLAGVAGSTNYVSQGWHTAGGLHDPALDLQPYNGAPAGTNVYFQSIHSSGATAAWAGVSNYPSSNGCTGYRLHLYSTWDWSYLGQVSLLHINKAAMADFYINPSGYTISHAGTTKHPDCHSSGAHLHEESNLYKNGGFFGGMTFNVWDDYYNWLFLIEY